MTIYTLERSTIAYTIRRSARARHGRIVLVGNKVEVILPKRGMTLKEAHEWVERKQQWIYQKQQSLLKERHHIPLTHVKKDLFVHQHWCHLGNMLPVTFEEQQKVVVPEIYLDEKTGIHFLTPYHFLKRQTAKQELLMIWKRWLHQRLAQEVELLIKKYGVPHGLIPTGVSIKQQKSLWGSCSHDGKIRLNLALILTSYPALEYVTVHELCHLAQPNHSKQFWELVEKILPNYQLGKEWLSRHHNLCAYFNPSRMDEVE